MLRAFLRQNKGVKNQPSTFGRQASGLGLNCMCSMCCISNFSSNHYTGIQVQQLTFEALVWRIGTPNLGFRIQGLAWFKDPTHRRKIQNCHWQGRRTTLTKPGKVLISIKPAWCSRTGMKWRVEVYWFVLPFVFGRWSWMKYTYIYLHVLMFF